MKKNLVIWNHGIHGRARYMFKAPHEYLTASLPGYRAEFIECPWRDLPVNRPLAAEYRQYLGMRTLDDDLRFTLEEMEKIFKRYPHEEYNYIIAGHSKGGLIALCAAQYFSIDKLILMAPAPPENIYRIKPTCLRLALFAKSLFSPIDKPVNRPRWAAKYGVLNRDMSDREIKEAWQNMVWESNKIIHELANFRGHRSLTVKMDRITAKDILIVGGSRDLLVPLEALFVLAQNFTSGNTRAQFLLVDSAHYMFFGTEGERICKELLSFAKN